jgi:hypothetical protein
MEKDTGFMGMISEDHSAVANLPQSVIQKTYPKCKYMDQYELDDTMRGIDSQIDDSIDRTDRHQSDSMY